MIVPGGSVVLKPISERPVSRQRIFLSDLRKVGLGETLKTFLMLGIELKETVRCRVYTSRFVRQRLSAGLYVPGAIA